MRRRGFFRRRKSMVASAHQLVVTAVSKAEAGERIPLPSYLSCVPAGFPSPASDYVESEIDLNEWLITNKLATYIVRVEGDSMASEIHPGDRLIVDRSLEPRPGDVVVACIYGEMTVKRLVGEDGRLLLVADNPAYPPIEINGDQELLIWGVVTNSIHRLR
jgi:DNA polymerase V